MAAAFAPRDAYAIPITAPEDDFAFVLDDPGGTTCIVFPPGRLDADACSDFTPLDPSKLDPMVKAFAFVEHEGWSYWVQLAGYPETAVLDDGSKKELVAGVTRALRESGSATPVGRDEDVRVTLEKVGDLSVAHFEVEAKLSRGGADAQGTAYFLMLVAPGEKVIHAITFETDAAHLDDVRPVAERALRSIRGKGPVEASRAFRIGHFIGRYFLVGFMFLILLGGAAWSLIAIRRSERAAR